jgi:hypothetical protein
MTLMMAAIIPTTQERPELLTKALKSAKCLPFTQVFVVSTELPKTPEIIDSAKGVVWIVSQANLPDSINEVVSNLGESFEYFGWIGDDDLFECFNPQELVQQLGEPPLIIGACRMIDESDSLIRILRPKRWRFGSVALSFLANPIAQPSTLISVRHFKSIGSLDSNLDLAFDYDLFLRLISHFGQPQLVNKTLASYRIHENTLSRTKWRAQLNQSAKIRLSISSPAIQPLVGFVDFLRERALSLLSH